MLPEVKMVLDRIAVKPAVIPDVSEGGILMPETMRKQLPTEGDVIALGPGALSLMGDRIPFTVQVGDRVTFEPLAVSQIALGDELLYIMTEDDVLAILED